MSTTPRFDFSHPTSLDEALELLAHHGDGARILAGGTDLIERMRAGIVKAEHLVSLAKVKGLDHVTFDEGSGLTIGASARISDVGKHEDVRRLYPTLATSCDVMCTPQICNMATVVGNVVNGSPSADTAPPLLIHDARVRLVSRDGEREVPLEEFFLGPGKVDRRPEEIVKEIVVPTPSPEAGTAFQRISARSKIDIAAVMVTALLEPNPDGRIARARIVLGAVAPTPLRCTEAEELLVGALPEPGVFTQAAEICQRTSRPIEDTRASAEWRKSMVGVLAERAIEEAAQVALGVAR